MCDGWCEQGGWVSQSSSGGNANATVTFLVPYKDLHWHGVCSGHNSGGNGWGNTGFNAPTSTTKGTINQWISGDGKFTDTTWIVGGYTDLTTFQSLNS